MISENRGATPGSRASGAGDDTKVRFQPMRKLSLIHLAILLLPFLAIGCSRSADDEVTQDELQAGELLVSALDAWKQGQAATLAQRSPPIRFVDEDWSEGAVLADYEIEALEAGVRPFEDVPVRLVLRDGGGNTTERMVSYQVTLEPALAILRSDP